MFGQDTATIFYQEKPYFTGDKIKVMSYRDCELNPELACYLLTVMRKAFQNFAWGQSSFNENVLKIWKYVFLWIQMITSTTHILQHS